MRNSIPVYVHLRRAKDRMDREYATKLDVPALAREAHASRAHFIRSFKSAFGETLHQYLLRPDGRLRWLTVTPADRPDQELVLAVPGPPMMDEESAAQVKALVAKGALGAGAFETDDCRGTFKELAARGVTFLTEPTERFYGIEATFRDNSGNWFSMTQRAGATVARWGKGARPPALGRSARGPHSARHSAPRPAPKVEPTATSARDPTRSTMRPPSQRAASRTQGEGRWTIAAPRSTRASPRTCSPPRSTSVSAHAARPTSPTRSCPRCAASSAATPSRLQRPPGRSTWLQRSASARLRGC